MRHLCPIVGALLFLGIYVMNQRRILVFGRAGSGKSTFSKQMAVHLNLPLFHLDRYFFTHSWQERDKQEFQDIHEKLIQRSQWIIDGNSLSFLAPRWQRATHILYFDLPKTTCVYRIFKRRFHKDTTVRDRAEDCPEIITYKFLKYLWRFEKRTINLIQSLQEKYPDIPLYRIKSDKEAQNLYKAL